MAVGTLKPPVISEGVIGVPTKPNRGNAGRGEQRETGSPREQHSFVAARPEVNAKNAWRSPSPNRRSETATFSEKSFSSRLAADSRRGSTADGPSNVRRTHVETVEATNAGEVSGKEKSTPTGGSRQERAQLLIENIDTAVARKTSRGNDGGGDRCDHDGSGDRSIHHDTAPKMLLAREAEAAVRRAERAATARVKEERELRLSSSFRAKEVEECRGLCLVWEVSWGLEATSWEHSTNSSSAVQYAGHTEQTHGI